MTDSHNHLLSTSPSNPYLLTPAPSTSTPFTCREQNFALYQLTLERDAVLSSAHHSFNYAVDSARSLYEIEKSKVEDEYELAQKSIKAKLIEIIDEKKRKLKEEKDMDIGVDAILDAQTYARSTRTSRNRKTNSNSLINSGTPIDENENSNNNNNSNNNLQQYQNNSFLGISIEDIISSSSNNLSGKRKKVTSAPQGMTGPFLGLGKSINAGLTGAKDIDIDADLSEIRKRRRRKY